MSSVYFQTRLDVTHNCSSGSRPSLKPKNRAVHSGFRTCIAKNAAYWYRGVSTDVEVGQGLH